MSMLKEKKKEFTREAIITAAEELFSHRGYHNTQIIDIVRAVGMSAGTFYKYFKDKRELFAFITRQSFADLRARVKEVRVMVDIWDRGDRMAKLNETFSAYFDYIDAHRQQYLIILRGIYGVDEEFDDSAWSYHNEITRDLAEDIRQWLELGVIEGANPATMACAVVGMTMHLAHTYLIDDTLPRDEAIETLSRMSNLIFEAHLTEAGREALRKANASKRRKRDEQQ